MTHASQSSVNTYRKCTMWFLADFEKTTISSRYASTSCNFTDHNMTPIARWNAAVASYKTNGFCTKWKSRWELVNAVIDLLHLSISICQDLELALNVEKILASSLESMYSSILCRGYKSLAIASLSLQ